MVEVLAADEHEDLRTKRGCARAGVRHSWPVRPERTTLEPSELGAAGASRQTSAGGVAPLAALLVPSGLGASPARPRRRA